MSPKEHDQAILSAQGLTGPNRRLSHPLQIAAELAMKENRPRQAHNLQATQENSAVPIKSSAITCEREQTISLKFPCKTPHLQLVQVIQNAMETEVREPPPTLKKLSRLTN